MDQYQQVNILSPDSQCPGMSSQSQNNILLVRTNWSTQVRREGREGHRYGNTGVKYPDRTDDENKETVEHILDNGTGHSSRVFKPRHVTYKRRVHTAWRVMALKCPGCDLVNVSVSIARSVII